MSCPLVVNFVADLTGDASIPAATIVRGSTATLEMVAKDCEGNVIDLADVDQLKVEAKKRFTSVTDPIFTATLSNGKITIVDAPTGRYDVELESTDTDFVGDAKLQFLYLMNDGRLGISEICILLFKLSFVEID